MNKALFSVFQQRSNNEQLAFFLTCLLIQLYSLYAFMHTEVIFFYRICRHIFPVLRQQFLIISLCFIRSRIANCYISLNGNIEHAVINTGA